MNDKAVYRTAPATPGPLNIAFRRFRFPYMVKSYLKLDGVGPTENKPSTE